MKKNKAFFQKIAKQINPEEIPEEVLSHIKYSSLLDNLEFQRKEDSCGLSSARSMLRLQWGIKTEEAYLEELMKEYNIKEIEIEGIEPRNLAKLIHHIGKENQMDLKVFCIEKGDYNQLDWLRDNNILPITHRKTRESNNIEHYEICLGSDKENIFLYNSYPDLSSSGFYKVSKSDFIKDWWPVRKLIRKERWYLGTIERKKDLPKNLFNEEYL